MNEIAAPHIEYVTLSPLFILIAAGVVGILVEAIIARRARYYVQVVLALLALVAATAQSIRLFSDLKPDSSRPELGEIAAMGSLAIDGPTLFMWIVLLVLGILAVMLFAERRLEGGLLAFAGQAAALPGTQAEREASNKGLEHTEVFPLSMFALVGMMLFGAASDLLTLFVALEVFSLPLYLLCGLARRKRLLSQEAALKYFILGAFSSGFFVYGIALIYGFSGSMTYAGIAQAVAGGGPTIYLIAGIGLMSVGLLFKIGAVPFHNWTPDVYQGAPTAVTAFMAAATKVAAFVALLRLFYVAFGGARETWLPMLWVVATITMLVGSVVALTQRDVKRLLAYSSVAHAGFLLVGVLGIRGESEVGAGGVDGVSAVLFYLTAYGLTTVAAFALVTVVRDDSGEVTSLERWAGLGKKSPLVAGTFAFLLLAMAGIPLTSGFTGKWAVFAAAFSSGAWPVVLLAVLISAIAVAFYLRLIAVMFFVDAEDESVQVAIPSPLTSTVVLIGTLATVVLGIVPGPLLDLLGRVAVFIR